MVAIEQVPKKSHNALVISPTVSSIIREFIEKECGEDPETAEWAKVKLHGLAPRRNEYSTPLASSAGHLRLFPHGENAAAFFPFHPDFLGCADSRWPRCGSQPILKAHVCARHYLERSLGQARRPPSSQVRLPILSLETSFQSFQVYI
jgi:hypothetical protein